MTTATQTHTPGPLEQWIEDHIQYETTLTYKLEVVPTASLLVRARQSDAIRAELLAALEAIATETDSDEDDSTMDWGDRLIAIEGIATAALAAARGDR